MENINKNDNRFSNPDFDGHNSVTTDYENERGEHPIGKLVHLATVTHAWRGKLKAVTPSYYILNNAVGQEISLVDSTGAISTYLANPVQVREGDKFMNSKDSKLVAEVRILRGAVSWMVNWTEAQAQKE